MKPMSFVLPLVLAASLGSIYVLPRVGDVAKSAISMELPAILDEWEFTPIPPSPEEVGTLGKETGFSKAICLKARPDEYTPEGRQVPDRIDLSIVLSGYDLNSSIHRPERCLPAQGHINLVGSTIPLKLTNGRTILIRRLRTTHLIRYPENRDLDRDEECVTYYFFVGHERTEYDHLKRTLADMQDRLVRGMDQRWAYVSASMSFGKLPWIEKPITEQEADAKLTDFLTRIAERQIDWEQITR